MTTSKYQKIESQFGNIYLIGFLGLVFFVCAGLMLANNYKLGYVLLTILASIPLSLSLLAKYKVKNRYAIEQGFNFLMTTFDKKVDSSRERVIVGEFIEYKGLFHIGFSYEVCDYDSLTKLSKEGFKSQQQADDELDKFVKQLPADLFELSKKFKKQKSEIPVEQFKRLGIEVKSYSDTFTYTYSLLLSVEKAKVEQAIDSLKTVFPAQLKQLNIEETIALLQ